MPDLKSIRTLVLPCVLMMLMSSCDKKYGRRDYTAYFGGEVLNPTTHYVLFCKDGAVLDTIPLKSNNTFFKVFDSLAPGLYSFRHDPEYQYVYFDKNDSLMVRVNARDFDESVVFCGRGDQKNNFLMEMYLKNENDKSQFYPIFDLGLKEFEKAIDSSYLASKKLYETKKEEIKWSEGFDKFAKASVDYHHYAKKEIYPVVHRVRTGIDLTDEIPASYYAFRKEVDYNDEQLSAYAPYLAYLSHMLGNLAAINYHNHFSEADLALKTNINKLQIADTLIKDAKVKNVILNNIAFTYLLEDQNMANNQKFLDIYHKYSTDNTKKNEIYKIGLAIKQLKEGRQLPTVKLVDAEGKKITSEAFKGKKTVFFCWTQKLDSHFRAAHAKAMNFKLRHPDYQFVAVNLDDDAEKWKQVMSSYAFPGIIEVRCEDFEDTKDKWAITKIHRTIIVNADGSIKNAFANLFDSNFEKELEERPFTHALTSK